MAGKGEKAAVFFRNGGDRAKAAGTKIYAVAKDPASRAKAQKLIDDGKKIYQIATSPEAKQLYRQVAVVIKKARKK